MKIGIIFVAAPIATSLTTPQQRSTNPLLVPPFESIVVFGDSLSDIGNIYEASGGTQPGKWSWRGRYCDGRVWIEYVAKYFGLPEIKASEGFDSGNGFAWGGATTGADYIRSFSTFLNSSVPSIDEQITDYLENGESTMTSRNGYLHSIWSGYNDYWWFASRNYSTQLGQELNFAKVYTTIVDELIHQVERLYNNGARLFLVGNVVNMTSWAEAELQTQDVLDAYNILVTGHNALLSDRVAQFEKDHHDATIYLSDAHKAFDSLNCEQNSLGFDDVFRPCHPSDYEDCGNPYSFKFWDYYHPTTHAHHYASIKAIQAILDKNYMRSAGHERTISEKSSLDTII